MSRRETPILVEDIWEAIEKIERYIAGLNHDTFIRDDKTIDSVVRTGSVKAPTVACPAFSSPTPPFGSQPLLRRPGYQSSELELDPILSEQVPLLCTGSDVKCFPTH